MASQACPLAISSPTRATVPVLGRVYAPTAKKPLALMAPATAGRMKARMARSSTARRGSTDIPAIVPLEPEAQAAHDPELQVPEVAGNAAPRRSTDREVHHRAQRDAHVL